MSKGKKSSAVMQVHTEKPGPEVTEDFLSQSDPGDEHVETAQRPKSQDRLEQLSPADLVPSPTNPRKYFDESALQELAASIKAHGILQPIVVRPNKRGCDAFEVVAGERRWRASLLAGALTIPCMVRDLSDVDVLEIQAIENNQRKDVLPLEEAHAYRNLLDSKAYGEGQEAIAKLAEKLGRSVSYVYQRLQLLKLVPEVQEYVLKGELEASMATEIARLQPDDQKQALSFATSGNTHRMEFGETVTVSYRRLKDWIQSNLMLDLSGAKFSTKSTTLLPQAGSCVDCPKRTGNVEALFPDIQKGDTCTDRACYHQKRLAHAYELLDKKKEELGASVPLSTGYDLRDWDGPKNRKPLGNGDYTTLQGPKECAGAILGVIVHAPYDALRIGEARWVCTDKNCPKHKYGNGARFEKSEDEKAREAEEKRKRKIEDLQRASLVQQIADRLPKIIDRDLLTTAVVGWWGEMQWDSQKLAVSLLGWEPPMGRRWDGKPEPDFRKAAEHCLPSLSDEDLVRAVIWLRFIRQVKVSTYDRVEPCEAIENLAAELGIDVAASRKEADAKFARKEPKAPKQDKPAKAEKPAKGKAKKEPPKATPAALKVIEVEGLILEDLQKAYPEISVITKDEVAAFLKSRSTETPAAEDAPSPEQLIEDLQDELLSWADQLAEQQPEGDILLSPGTFDLMVEAEAGEPITTEESNADPAIIFGLECADPPRIYRRSPEGKAWPLAPELAKARGYEVQASAEGEAEGSEAELQAQAEDEAAEAFATEMQHAAEAQAEAQAEAEAMAAAEAAAAAEAEGSEG